MAINGIVEAYTYAKADSKVLRKLQKGLIVISLVYIGASCILARYIGIVGLVYGNCINMSLRIY